MFSGIQRCKSLAKLIKSQRAPPWPSLPRVDLPSKDVADELVDCYLRATETIYRILHVTSFKRDYDALWVSGTEPDGAFLVQLKLVFAIGSITYDENFSLRTSAIRWVHEAQHYLSTPNFKSRLNIQSLQTHILLLLAREGLHIGGELIWISAGSLFRTSVFMGLHRDPDHLPKRTTFAAEMRRRLWNTILEITLQTSITSGTPPFISLLDFDTEPPRNFDDDQLIAEDARAKPEDHFTQSSLAIALRKTFPLRLAITKFLNDLGSSGTYREMLRLDTDLRVSYKALRQTLQAYNSNTLTPPSQFQLRAVDALINHYLSALHIPFLGPALNSTTHAFSRKVVLETALKIWCATYPSSISPTTSNSTVPPSSTPDDFSRFTSCGSGFFRTIAFQASVLIVFSLKTQLQEEETTGPVPLRPDLFAVLENAKTWTLQCIKSGQTNNKCYLLMCIVIAQMRGRVHERNEFEAADSQSVIMKAAEEAEETCLAILQEMAANGQTGADAAVDMQDPMSSNIPSEAMQDCDFMASYQEPFKHNLAYVLWQNADALFNFGGAEPMSWLFGNGSTEDSSLW